MKKTLTNTKNDKTLAEVYHFSLYGKREDKYKFLSENSVKSIHWNELEPKAPQHYFVKKDFELLEEYEKGIKVSELFPVNGVGLTTAHDEFVIDESKENLLKKFQDFKVSERNADILHEKFNVAKKMGWNILQGYDNLQKIVDIKSIIQPISYRPFDTKFIIYEDKLVWRTVRKVMQHFLHGENVGLNWIRPMSSKYEFDIFVSNNITDQCSAGNKSAGAGISYIAPLYLYQSKLGSDELVKVPNLNMEIIDEVALKLGLKFIPDHEHADSGKEGTFNPLDVLDYIYAILHSPKYRERYKEFLKIDFPRVPFTSDQKLFWSLVEKGREIRQYHLMEHANSSSLITQYPVAEENEVINPRYSENKVWLNDTQYFDNVPQVAWEFYIGGYQPAQKWLKDRKGRKLSFDDVLHYQKIIVALANTDRLMQEIDALIPKWPIK